MESFIRKMHLRKGGRVGLVFNGIMSNPRYGDTFALHNGWGQNNPGDEKFEEDEGNDLEMNDIILTVRMQTTEFDKT